MRIYMWRDRHDGDMVQLGNEVNGRYVCWGQMHIDGVAETFGEGVKHAIGKRTLMSLNNKHDETPLCVETESLIVDGETVE